MKNLFFLTLVTLFIGSNANASYIEACEFEAEVKTTTPLGVLNEKKRDAPIVAVVELKKVLADKGSHSEGACERHLDNDIKVIEVGEKLSSFEKSARVKLYYFYSNSITPGHGTARFTSWNLLED